MDRRSFIASAIAALVAPKLPALPAPANQEEIWGESVIEQLRPHVDPAWINNVFVLGLCRLRGEDDDSFRARCHRAMLENPNWQIDVRDADGA